MSKISVFFIFVFFMSIIPAALGFGAEPTRQALLRDGFVLRGVDGKLIGPEGNDVWFFELSTDVNDHIAVVKAGTRLELLPSSGLEKMIADANERSATTYRLWNGTVTKYKGRNYIFPNYFTSLSTTKKQPPQISKPSPRGPFVKREPSQEPPKEQKEPTDTTSEQEPVIDEPNDILAVPKEIIEKLRARREKIADREKAIEDSNKVEIEEQHAITEKEELPSTDDSRTTPTEHYTPSADSILVDRTAFLRKQNGRLVFVPDALGRNVQQLSLRLLPCEALELTERRQSAIPEPIRFKIAGIMTKYKGEEYLLLQKAIQVYNHGNFGR